MSKWEKLLQKIKNMSRDIRFDEIKKILESYGYTAYNPSSGKVAIGHLESPGNLL